MQILNAAGLGKKKVTFHKNGNHDHIRKKLEESYPTLTPQNGAFQLLRCEFGGSGSRDLNTIAMPQNGYSVPFLKEQSKSSLIYIRPLNCDIEFEMKRIEPVELPTCTASAICKSCNKTVPLSYFEQHQHHCQGAMSTDKDSDKDKINNDQGKLFLE